MLELKNIQYAYGKEACVKDTSLHIPEGKIFCLLGPSGCGKSTLLRLIAGLERLQGGSITIGGTPVSTDRIHVPTENREIGMVFQDYALFPHMTVEENIRFGLKKLSSTEKKARVQEVLAQVDIAELAKRYPHTLSGGQQQRVALARAIAPRPKLILLDEPFSGLDSMLRQRLRDESLKILQAAGISTLMVTHDGQEALHLGDKIIIMREGRFVQIGTPDELYFQPRSPFVTEFFGNINLIRGKIVSDCVECPLGEIPVFGLAQKSEVQLVIRHEAVELSRQAPTGKRFVVPVRVKRSRSLGPYIETVIALRDSSDALQLTAKTPGHQPFRTAEELYASFNPNLVHAYDLSETYKPKLLF